MDGIRRQRILQSNLYIIYGLCPGEVGCTKPIRLSLLIVARERLVKPLTQPSSRGVSAAPERLHADTAYGRGAFCKQIGALR